MSVVTLSAGDGRVDVAPEVGGAIAAFTLHGMDVLRPTSATELAVGNVRACGCFPLVPYSNRIARAMLHADGREYALARNFGDHPHSIHGVGWQRPWRASSRSGDAVTLGLEHVPLGDAACAWPFAFRATQAFALAADASAAMLTVSLAIENTGAQAFPFGLGWHPYFPKTADTRLAFAAVNVWENDATQLPLRQAPVPAGWRCDPARTLGALALDHVFSGWNGCASIAWPERGLAVTLDADRALNHLVVFVPSERDFLAVEPVTHMTDAFNRHAVGQAATGTRILGPGEAFSCTMRLRAAPLPR